jgi:hypothetical protein
VSENACLLAGQASELDRLQLQSRVWEPAGRRLLDKIGEGRGARPLDVGCGVRGWLRLLSEWVGPDGEVMGTDIDDAMFSAADQFVAAEGLRNVALVKDDLFASELEAGATSKGGGGRASGARPLGHHVHAPPGLGSVRSVASGSNRKRQCPLVSAPCVAWLPVR